MRTEAKEIVRETRGTRTGAGREVKEEEEEEKESGGGEGKEEVAFATCSGVSAARYSIMISRRDYLMFTDSLLAGA
ncbi:hypothetical protein PV325_004468 [Microctonus aethiopoides]|nr:hypothetical protein PV325_004468 [Microctonus aethiopoides]